MDCDQCAGIELETKEWVVEDLENLRQHKLDRATAALIDTLLPLGVEDRTLLDIGGGLGAVQHAFLRGGASRVVSVEASTSYLAAAKDEAARLGFGDRITFHHGDFVALASQIAPADFVTLDHVICCYHDMYSLVSLSSARARRYYGVVYPTGDWWNKLGVNIENLISRLKRSPFRAFVHSPALVDAAVRRNGLRQVARQEVFVWPSTWQVVVYQRQNVPARTPAR